METEVVGRETQLTRLDHMVGALNEGPASLVIEGEAGIGKTSLWETALRAAADHSYRILVSRPAESESALAYSGLADLLANVDLAAIDDLPVPQRQALEVALLRSSPAGRPPQPLAIFTAFGAVLRVLSREQPVLVAVDDLQWLDRSSLRALEFVLRRLTDERVGVLATSRRDRTRVDGTGLPDAAVLEVGPLSPAALHHLIKAHVDVSLSRSTVLRVHRTTGGNPFFSLELARALVTADMPRASDPWPVPDDLRDMVAARIELLPHAVRSTLLTAAASARSTISGLGAAALRSATRADIVRQDEHGQVRFAHPLFASAIYRSATPEEQRQIHAALATEATDVEEQARHSALACNGADESVAARLDEAAATARARGAPDVAAELEERSIALTPVDRPERAWQRRMAAADHYFHAGDLKRARTLLVELVQRDEPAVSRSTALRLLGEVTYQLNSLDDAHHFLTEAVDAAAGDLDSVARAELDLSFVLFHSFASFKEAAAAAKRALAAAEALGDDALLSSALAGSAVADFVVGRGLDEAKLARALATEDLAQSTAIEMRPSMLAGRVLLYAGQLDRARSLFTSLHERLVDRGEESDLPDLLGLLAHLECLSGNLVEAATLAEHGYDLARQAGSESLAATTRAVSALVAAHGGRATETRAAAAEAIELAERSHWLLAAFWASTALGLLELSLGDNQAVVTTLAQSMSLIEEHGLAEPSRAPFLPDAIEALIHLGELERADRLTQMLEERGRALGRGSAIIAGARCRALILAARGNVALGLMQLERILADDLPRATPLEAARTLIVKGQLERRRKQKRAARDSLESAVQRCEQIGATLWAERARTELARLGPGTDRRLLTATEARVAALAASGLTNREIAASAFMTQKTVEANLSRIYRKLDIRSRAELGIKLLQAETANRRLSVTPRLTEASLPAAHRRARAQKRRE